MTRVLHTARISNVLELFEQMQKDLKSNFESEMLIFFLTKPALVLHWNVREYNRDIRDLVSEGSSMKQRREKNFK